MESLGRPTILLLSLEFESWFDEMYATLIDKLSAKAAIQRAKKPDAVMRYMQATRLTAILLTDAALSRRENSNVLDKVLEYAKSGGIVVVMGHFSSFVDGDGYDYFFGSLGLGWERGVYERTNTQRTSVAPVDVVCYSQKAQCAQVRDLSHIWYRHPGYRNQAAVAMAPLGEGKVGYVGDINTEPGTDAVILAMCGL